MVTPQLVTRVLPVLIALFVALSARGVVLPCDVRVGAAVTILGGGPSGLVLGYFLKRAGVPFVILERGATVGDSWARMPTNLRLISYWHANELPGGPPVSFRRNEQIPASAFAGYLREYAELHQLPVETDVTVSAVARDGTGFRVETSHGPLVSPLVVSATGYFGRPVRPAYPGVSTIPHWHAAEFRDAAWLRRQLPVVERRPRVLVVGQGLSAGQLLEELAEDFTLVLSHRSPLRFGPRPEIEAFYLQNQIDFERPGPFQADPTARMSGGLARTLIERGVVPTRPEIARWEGSRVLFSNGMREDVDAVLFATGYRPALGHLQGLVTTSPETGLPPALLQQSTEVPGLYFLGLDRGRTHTSRFLRGIRQDAPILATALVGELRRRGILPP